MSSPKRTPTDDDALAEARRHDWSAKHRGQTPERASAWHPAERDAGSEAPERARTTGSARTHGPPISWRALDIGSDVISSDGTRVGLVQEVVADIATDIFEGVVIDTRLGPGGLRFVDASLISDIFVHRLVLTATRSQVHELPPARGAHHRSR